MKSYKCVCTPKFRNKNKIFKKYQVSVNAFLQYLIFKKKFLTEKF